MPKVSQLLALNFLLSHRAAWVILCNHMEDHVSHCSLQNIPVASHCNVSKNHSHCWALCDLLPAPSSPLRPHLLSPSSITLPQPHWPSLYFLNILSKWLREGAQGLCTCVSFAGMCFRVCACLTLMLPPGPCLFKCLLFSVLLHAGKDSSVPFAAKSPSTTTANKYLFWTKRVKRGIYVVFGSLSYAWFKIISRNLNFCTRGLWPTPPPKSSIRASSAAGKGVRVSDTGKETLLVSEISSSHVSDFPLSVRQIRKTRRKQVSMYIQPLNQSFS